MAETTKEVAEKSDAGDPLAKYSIHPAAAIFPLMDEEPLNRLADDIKRSGFQEPIVMHEGQVVDGRNRLVAYCRAGVEPTLVEWTGKGSVVAWIISINLHRRHLTDQQRAMVVARVAAEMAVEGKLRSIQNLRNSGGLTEKLDPESRTGSSSKKAASLLGVSPDAVTKAGKVMKSGSGKLTEALSKGDISLDAASLISELPNKKQDELVSGGKAEVKEATKKLREAKKATSNRKNHKSASVQTRKPVVPDIAPESTPAQPESMQKEMGALEPITAKPKAKAAYAELPLVEKLHESIEGLVAAARLAGKLDHLESPLNRLILCADRWKLRFEKAALV